jgi:hypothetical protein
MDKFRDLDACSILHQYTFSSDVPVIGPLIARFRAIWNSIAAQWYVDFLVQQQTVFNQLVVRHIRQLDTHCQELDARCNELDARCNGLDARCDESDVRLLDAADARSEMNDRWSRGDREQVLLRRDLAEVTLRMVQMNQLIAALDKRLVDKEGQ